VEHVVFFTNPDGSSLFRRTPSLEDAVRFVEHLRNVEGVEDFSVFSMTNVPLAVRTVYRVELPGEERPESDPESGAAPEAADEAPAPAPETATEPEGVTEPEAAAAEEPAEPLAELSQPVHPEPMPAELSHTPAFAEPAPEFEALPVMAGASGVEAADEAVVAESAQNGKGQRGLGFFSR
jgi:hypothetical protein